MAMKVEGGRTAGPREEPLVQIEQQAKALAEQLAALRTLLYRRDEQLREARAALMLLSRSRVYRLMRVLGRWGWLERRINRVLQ